MGNTHGIQVPYWMLTAAQYAIFYQDYPEEARLFTQIGDNYYLKESSVSDRDAFEELLWEWDMEDGNTGGGPNSFISDYWTLSNVPNSMWP